MALVFQSTRPRGARPPQLRHISGGLLFQSTRPRGARRALYVQPVQGARFNPRARVGRDRRGRLQACRQVAFQSTRPRGARRREILDYLE